MRNGHVSAQTVRRWQLRGLRGIYLESAMVGGARCSTMAHLEAFFLELTNLDNHRRFYVTDNPQTPPLTGLKKTRRHEAAELEARNLGI
ncbi:MAG: DUF1580 domain-containing protein [bacterium]